MTSITGLGISAHNKPARAAKPKQTAHPSFAASRPGTTLAAGAAHRPFIKFAAEHNYDNLSRNVPVARRESISWVRPLEMVFDEFRPHFVKMFQGWSDETLKRAAEMMDVEVAQVMLQRKAMTAQGNQDGENFHKFTEDGMTLRARRNELRDDFCAKDPVLAELSRGEGDASGKSSGFFVKLIHLAIDENEHPLHKEIAWTIKNAYFDAFLQVCAERAKATGEDFMTEKPLTFLKLTELPGANRVAYTGYDKLLPDIKKSFNFAENILAELKAGTNLSEIDLDAAKERVPSAEEHFLERPNS